MIMSKLKVLILSFVGFGILALMSACTKDDSNTTIPNNDNTNESKVEFVDILR